MTDLVEYQQDNPQAAYEKADWRLDVVGWVFLAIVVFLAAAPLALIWAYPKSVEDTDRRLAMKPPGPRLEIDPPADYAKFRVDEERRLNTYYWIDKTHGVVHIPIDAAMRKVAKDGIPGFPRERQ